MRVAPPSTCATRCKPPNPASAGSCSPATRSISPPTARPRRWPSGSWRRSTACWLPMTAVNASLQRLTTVINEKFAEMDQSIALKRDYRDADALALVRTNRGKALMDEANIFFAGIISATDERLTTGVAEQKANATLLRLFSIISGIVIVIVIGIAAVTVVRYTRELRRRADRSKRAERRPGAARRSPHRRSGARERRDPALRPDHLARPSRAAGQHRRLHRRTCRTASGACACWSTGPMPAAEPTTPMLQEARAAATELLPEAIGYIRSSTREDGAADQCGSQTRT